MAYCSNCGRGIPNGSTFCTHCGSVQSPSFQAAAQNSGPTYVNVNHVSYIDCYPYRSQTVALLLCLFLGVLGAHRFYVGKIGTGLLYLFTGGLFGIGWIVDLILIVSGSFRDRARMPLT